MKNHILYINTNSDKNIFHTYMMEILEIQRLHDNNISIEHMLLTDFNPKDLSDNWRVYILQYLVKNIYVNYHKIDHDIVKNAPREITLYTPKMLEIHFKWYECWKPIQPNHIPNPNIIEFFERLKSKMNVTCSLNHIKFVNRKSCRKVYDLNTNVPFENILSLYGIQCTYFEDLSAKEQIDFVKDSKILIAVHGAGLTNMLFTHPDCIIVEISLRKYWYCDPICNAHKFGKLNIEQDCKKGPPFYKYDYINMAKILNKKHVEILPDKYTDQSVMKMLHRDLLIDSNTFIRTIKNLDNQYFHHETLYSH